ncbi:YdeI/OmpD-associated family protein [Nocardia vinacea]|uniref:YdeI/OmpD-associated family protein n=1 Tax=Nocardia vinacea TaxID=96468 RepID=UPI002E0DCA58|nr:YdeI/OmpD-associated family protein [Nocardia vinacea]
MPAQDRPVLFFPDEQSFRDWLLTNHASADGVWLRFAKKDSGRVSLNHAGALRQALCFGWIDGQARGEDAEFWQVGFTPRRKRSPWSLRNIGLVAELIVQGLMHPAGQAEIDRAKADGRWDLAYGASVVPADFLAALARNPEAEAFFQTLGNQQRAAVGYLLADAVKPETRARRIEKFVQKFADGQTLG